MHNELLTILYGAAMGYMFIRLVQVFLRSPNHPVR